MLQIHPKFENVLRYTILTVLVAILEEKCA